MKAYLTFLSILSLTLSLIVVPAWANPALKKRAIEAVKATSADSIHARGQDQDDGGMTRSLGGMQLNTSPGPTIWDSNGEVMRGATVLDGLATSSNPHANTDIRDQYKNTAVNPPTDKMRKSFCRIWNEESSNHGSMALVGECAALPAERDLPDNAVYIDNGVCFGLVQSRVFFNTGLNPVNRRKSERPVFKHPKTYTNTIGSGRGDGGFARTMSKKMSENLTQLVYNFMFGEIKTESELRRRIKNTMGQCQKDHIAVSNTDKALCESLVDAENKAAGDQAILKKGSCKVTTQGVTVGFNEDRGCDQLVSLPLVKAVSLNQFRIVEPKAIEGEYQSKRNGRTEELCPPGVNCRKTSWCEYQRQLITYRRTRNTNKARRSLSELLFNHKDNFSDAPEDLLLSLSRACKLDGVYPPAEYAIRSAADHVAKLRREERMRDEGRSPVGEREARCEKNVATLLNGGTLVGPTGSSSETLTGSLSDQ